MMIPIVPNNNVWKCSERRVERPLRLKTAIKLLTISFETLHRYTMQKPRKFRP